MFIYNVFLTLIVKRLINGILKTTNIVETVIRENTSSIVRQGMCTKCFHVVMKQK